MVLILSCLLVKSQIINDSLIQKSQDLIEKNRFPGVYVEEINVNPKTVAQVETGIPAFIGYTQIARKNTDNDLILNPIKITSFSDYEDLFGYENPPSIIVSVSNNTAKGFRLESFDVPDFNSLMYYSVKMFFDNGGGSCYIISAGTLQKKPLINPTIKLSNLKISSSALNSALKIASNIDEPALLVVPDAVSLSSTNYQILVRQVLNQCISLEDRFAIFDLFQGNMEPDNISLELNREYFGINGLKYGAVYYPFLKTNYTYAFNSDSSNVIINYSGKQYTFGNLKLENQALYDFVKNQIKEQTVVMPPSGAVAGIYAKNDRDRGVWKSPANIRIQNILGPLFKINTEQQNNLSIDSKEGISINPIINFAGKGTVIWGARTMAGNDNEWRYISVQRFTNMVLESVKKSTEWVMFEPNDVNTWTKVRQMIENYLTTKWREGALQGATPTQAFYVHCGLGQTMTNQDILDGKIIVEIGLAEVRPAEFIVLRFSHKVH